MDISGKAKGVFLRMLAMTSRLGLVNRDAITVLLHKRCLYRGWSRIRARISNVETNFS